jgi:hypothetical protein
MIQINYSLFVSFIGAGFCRSRVHLKLNLAIIISVFYKDYFISANYLCFPERIRRGCIAKIIGNEGQ